MKTLLLLEDDIIFAKDISATLSQICSITHVDSVDQACHLIDKQKFDLAIVDRMLPDGDGMEVICYLADISQSTKVIALTKRSQLNERIAGLEQGADDYLPKPFSLLELKLKVKKLLLFEKQENLERLSSGTISLAPSTGEVQLGSEIVRLRKKESQILYCLMRHQNQVLPRQKIIEEAWNLDEEIPSQTTLDVYIRRLRILLKSYGKCLVTKRGFGYAFIPLAG
jgi:DNA-binding response OmpR family regulator